MTPIEPHIVLVCLVCRPAFDAGRRAGMEYAIQVITTRPGADSRQLIKALQAVMPASRRAPVLTPAAALPDKPRRKPHTHLRILAPTDPPKNNEDPHG